jgi:hypothetical protein
VRTDGVHLTFSRVSEMKYFRVQRGVNLWLGYENWHAVLCMTCSRPSQVRVYVLSIYLLQGPRTIAIAQVNMATHALLH